MSVHNHPPYEPDCAERLVGGCQVVIDPESRERAEQLIRPPRVRQPDIEAQSGVQP